MTSDVNKYDPDQALANRKLPPMAQMTRVQKRYFLEPWMTTLTIGFWVIAAVGYILAMFSQLHVEFACFGGLFTLFGAGTLCTKMNFMEWNSRTEGELRVHKTYYD